jgi:hypothetical protein
MRHVHRPNSPTASGSLFRRVNAAVPDLGYDNEPSDPRMPFGGIKNSG